MTTTAWKFAKYAFNTWTNTSNIFATDGNVAQNLAGPGSTTNPLIPSNFGFTPSDIPDGVTITGIEFRIVWKKFGGMAMSLSQAQLRDPDTGLATGDNKSGSAPAPTNTLESFTLGGTNDTWNAAFAATPSKLRSTQFGIFLRGLNGDAKFSYEFGVDSVECRVTYADSTTTTTTTAATTTTTVVTTTTTAPTTTTTAATTTTTAATTTTTAAGSGGPRTTLGSRRFGSQRGLSGN